MHCVWEGNFRRFFNNIKNHLTEEQIELISSRTTSIKPPTKILRDFRHLKEFKDIAASEKRNLGWFGRVPCTLDCINADELRLCAVFAEATFILNKDCILDAELDRVEHLLRKYREIYERIFPENR